MSRRYCVAPGPDRLSNSQINEQDLCSEAIKRCIWAAVSEKNVVRCNRGAEGEREIHLIQ
jgi:hypothetical protein